MNTDKTPPNPPLWLAMLATSMAGGMGWGIRGQYGHETGAMIAGALVSSDVWCSCSAKERRRFT